MYKQELKISFVGQVLDICQKSVWHERNVTIQRQDLSVNDFLNARLLYVLQDLFRYNLMSCNR